MISDTVLFFSFFYLEIEQRFNVRDSDNIVYFNGAGDRAAAVCCDVASRLVVCSRCHRYSANLST